MLIKKLIIRNFKSFGNSEQKLEFDTNKGSLTLLKGANGNGKSSILESIDYTLFKTVKGKTTKKLKLTTLPNRINKELLTTIEFISNDVTIKIERGISPNVLRLYENGILNDKAGKTNIDKLIEQYIGMDFETFKSFISMSINDFKNFINLSNEDKKILLDKLFNLETINVLNDILKGLVKTNKQNLLILDKEIETLNESVGSIKKSIEKSKEKQNENLEIDIENIKKTITEKKPIYTGLKERLEKINLKEVEIDNLIQIDNSELITLKNELTRTKSDIQLYENDICPSCHGDLTTEFHEQFKEELLNKKSKMEELGKELSTNLSKLNTKKEKLLSIKSETTKLFNDLKYELQNLKNNLEKLTTKINENGGNESLEEFEVSIKELKSKKDIGISNKEICDNKKLYYKELSEVFSETGIKRSIIKNIITPLNHYIEENMKIMKIPFKIKLDDKFKATITQLGIEIDPETFSTGELKKTNIAIMISFLKLIRTKKNINILFLDEVFSSIDVDGIDNVLNLFRNFANEYNINIFVVHHADLNPSLFDRIITVNKNIFSSIDIEKDSINERI